MSTDGGYDATAADVPAGGAGADTGAVDATRVDPDDRAEIPNVSSQNDAPGVGIRGGTGWSSSSELEEDQAARARTTREGNPADGGRRAHGTGFDTPDRSTAGGSIEDLEPGVDPESARTSKAVRSADLPHL